MQILDKIIELLSDGEWHFIHEVAGQLHNEVQTLFAIELLHEYGFAEISGSVKVALSKRMLEFWRKIKEIEKAET